MTDSKCSLDPHTVADHRPATVTCEVRTDFAGLADLREQWDRFVQAVGADVYFTFDWCRIWWEHYGAGRKLQIFLFRAGDELVGILPMFIERAWLGPVWLRLAKLIGADHSLTILTPPVQGDWAAQIFATVLPRLLVDHRCDAVHFGPLSGEYAGVEALRASCEKLCDLLDIRRTEASGPHTMFDLPDSFDTYLANLNKRQRGNYRRDVNLITREFAVRTDVVSGVADVVAEFEAFRRMHDLQWQAEGRLGHFRDWPRAVSFNSALIQAQAAAGRVRFVRILANDQVVSSQYCFRFGATYYWRLPARSVGQDWDRYGMGRLGLIKMIEAAIGEGVRKIEGGAGHYDYKVQLGGKEYSISSTLVVAKRLSSRIRADLYGRLSDLLHLLYYRIWFLRIAPRMPAAQRSLWKTWIRSRF